jgi:energy-coupling factor transporter ATP-binding protein EcfA2
MMRCGMPERRPYLALTALLVLGNLALYYLARSSTAGASFTTLTNLIMFIIISGTLGYLMGKSENGLASLIELLVISYILLEIVGMRLTLSTFTESLTIVAPPYLAGLALSSSFFRELPIRIPKLSIDRYVIYSLLGILGFSLIFTYLLNTFGIFIVKLPDTLNINLQSSIWLGCLVVNSVLVAVVESNTLQRDSKLLIPAGVSAALSILALPAVVEYISIIPATSEAFEGVITLGRIRKRLSGKGWVSSRGSLKITFKARDNSHAVIVGASGTGKSTLAKDIANQLARSGVNLVIIDVHGEYLTLAQKLGGDVISPVTHPLNPLELMDKEPEVRAEEVADLLMRTFRLGHIQKSALYNILIDTYRRTLPRTPTFDDVADTLNTYIVNGFGIAEGVFTKETLQSLIPYINVLRGKGAFAGYVKPSELVKGLTVIDLSTIDSKSVARIYVETLLTGILSSFKLRGGNLTVVVEEAHSFSGRKQSPSILAKIFREGRKFGINVIAISQQPLDMDPAIMTNAKYVISFSIRETANLAYISRLIAGNVQERHMAVKRAVSSLSKFEAVVGIRETDKVYLIKV